MKKMQRRPACTLLLTIAAALLLAIYAKNPMTGKKQFVLMSKQQLRLQNGKYPNAGPQAGPLIKMVETRS